MLLREIKSIFHKELDRLYPKDETNSFFYILIEHYLGLERFILALQPNLSLTKEEEQPLFEALSKLKLKCPVQYITGVTHFMDLQLKVNEAVLIPRPETEELVRWILDDHTDKERKTNVLDIGTGSGCIAIALAQTNFDWSISAMDISKEALTVAKNNALGNKVNVDFFEEDILKVPSLERKFDIIVSNPPYVREMEKKEMSANVLEYEPSLALFVENDHPLVFYSRIVEFSKKHLVKDGCLYFEINQYLGKEMVRLLGDNYFSEIELRKDMYGNDRMVKAVWKD
ncbi:peptide chain release factor N(5)-glutamine methyltransferase [Euzebyella marina]|uniref:Release factor glutamine methyltransferase n=1 Tax=Euzebyella marina TaxID=1761453 RepID=A0A3G2L6K8_9FLAO|nr:peptide chain release factor N(5)-glutamine methyltransferase [Euzebyella marina]AYN67876.1 peptide chain release factor N(5)-glutamine methyltransferase [Euzebyella marina]